MSRTFTYARVSTIEQKPENQIREIEAAGFKVEPHRIISETVSGSVAIAQRKDFPRLIRPWKWRREWDWKPFMESAGKVPHGLGGSRGPFR